MRLAFQGWQRLVCTAQALLLLATTPAFASLNASDSLSLARYETETFGQASPDDTEKKRLDRLELKLYGKTHNQSTKARLAAIGSTLSAEHKQLLLPPMAAQLDTSQSTGLAPNNQDIPKAAPEIGDSYTGDSPVADAKEGRLQQTLSRAMQEYAAGNKSAAQSDFQKVLKLDPRNADAHYNLGAMSEAAGDFQTALNHYELAQAQTPGDNDIAQAVSSVKSKLQYQQLTQNQAAQAQQAQQQQKQRDQLKSLAAQAASDYHGGNYDGAISKLNNVANQAPNDPDVQYALAQAYRGKNNKNAARAHLNKAIALDPNNTLYRNALAGLGNSQNYDPSMPPAAPDYNDQGQGQLASAPQNTGPVGQLTPFSDTGGSGMQYGRAYSSGGASGIMRFLPALGLGLGGLALAPQLSGGSSYEGNYSNGGSHRIARAMQGGLAGAAIGALLTRNSPEGMSGGAMKGALFGGAVGLLFGR